MFTAMSEYNTSNDKMTVLDKQLKECIRAQVKSFGDRLKVLAGSVELPTTVCLIYEQQ
jgi:hypothetical protein